MKIKKAIAALTAVLMVGAVFTGCEKVGFKEGTYNGTAIDTYGGEENTATAKVVINSEGKIESVYLDTTYNGSTKKTLGNDYNMKKYNSNAAGEWFEQVEALEEAIVENQGIEFLNLDENGKTDAVSGCTIQITALVKAVDNALEQAK